MMVMLRKPRAPYRRDPQARRVYSAENAAFLSLYPVSAAGRTAPDLPELADVQRYLDKVCADRWFVRCYGTHAFRAGDGRGMSRTQAHAEGGTVTVRRDARARWVVLHEVAHCLQPSDSQHHGPEYVRIYLALVRHFLGRQAWRVLRLQFRLHRVKTQTRKRQPGGSRPMGTSERAALVARLARGREMRAAERDAHRFADYLEQSAERQLDEEPLL